MAQGSRHRGVYLEDQPYEVALQKYLSALETKGSLQPLPAEELPVEQALGRVTADPVWAKVSSPHYHASAMDGVAVRAEDTQGATETSPLHLKIGEQAHWVDTGSPVPPGFNSVIMVEHVQDMGDGRLEILAAVPPWQHVRLMGEDMVATELVLPEGHRLRPVDLGAVAASGHASVVVRRRPRVAIIPTGDELVAPGQDLKPGNIIEFNSLVLAGLVEEWGGTATRLAPVPDDRTRLEAAVMEALTGHDMVVINAGSSAGSKDYTAPVIAALGEVVVHGIAIRPGHPVVLGIVSGKPVLGIPGYPVSAVLSFELTARPILCRWLGIAPEERPTMPGVITRKVLSPMGEDEYLRVRVGKVGDAFVATPLPRGAGVITSLVRADGLVVIPRFSEGLQAGSSVSIQLLRSKQEIENTIVCTGSHDLILDVLSNELHKRYPQMSLASSNVGSLGGLMAVKRGEAHMAGSHLLDEQTGEYNVSYLKRLLPGVKVVLVTLTHRLQGLIVARGNPKRLTGLGDLVRGDIQYINRQREAGTRVLLDYHLKLLGISPEEIRGYDRVEYTHLAVAASVASGAADVGLGILAAARALDLDFVPLFTERYDLVIPEVFFKGPLLKPLLDFLHEAGFRAQVEALGGYETGEMGKVIPVS
ncbi:MAG: molybdopterin biosynthesis protein [Chloroflexota bacterium]